MSEFSSFTGGRMFGVCEGIKFSSNSEWEGGYFVCPGKQGFLSKCGDLVCRGTNDKNAIF